MSTKEPRAFTAYQAFFKETLAKVKSQLASKKRSGEKWGSADQNAAVKEVGKRWRALSDAQKQKFAGSTQQTVPKATGKRKAAAAKKAAKKPRKLSAYNMFVRERSQALQNLDSAARMKKIGNEWKALSDRRKQDFQSRADAYNAANPPVAPPATDPAPSKKRKRAPSEPRGLSAYQAFFKETLAKVKSQLAAKKRPDEKWGVADQNAAVKEVGKRWRALSDAQKQKFAGSSTQTAPAKRKAKV